MNRERVLHEREHIIQIEALGKMVFYISYLFQLLHFTNTLNKYESQAIIRSTRELLKQNPLEHYIKEINAPE